MDASEQRSGPLSAPNATLTRQPGQSSRWYRQVIQPGGVQVAPQVRAAAASTRAPRGEDK